MLLTPTEKFAKIYGYDGVGSAKPLWVQADRERESQSQFHQKLDRKWPSFAAFTAKSVIKTKNWPTFRVFVTVRIFEKSHSKAGGFLN